MNQQKIRALESIKKKLLGKSLSYKDAYAIMDQFSKRELDDIYVAYFAAASFRGGFSLDELYFLTKAMVETGKKFNFKGIVADKHSIGGLPGTRTTLIVVPIVAAAGYLIPKTSSRAITSPAGTADCMEVLAPVNIPFEKIKKIVEKTGGCIIWGGHLGIAPADDIIIRVEEKLSFESYDKIIISILAKKVAAASKFLVLDIPVGPTMKIKYVHDAKKFAKRFSQLAHKFGIKVKTDINHLLNPSGFGIGPMLETKDALKVLEQAVDRPQALEFKSLKLASRLLDMCFAADNKHQDGLQTAELLLKTGKALLKFKEIIKAQGGNPDIGSQDLQEAKYAQEIVATRSGVVQLVNSYNISSIAKILGAPKDKKAGMLLYKKFGDKVVKNDILMKVFAEDKGKLTEALETLKNLPVYEIGE